MWQHRQGRKICGQIFLGQFWARIWELSELLEIATLGGLVTLKGRLYNSHRVKGWYQSIPKYYINITNIFARLSFTIQKNLSLNLRVKPEIGGLISPSEYSGQSLTYFFSFISSAMQDTSFFSFQCPAIYIYINSIYKYIKRLLSPVFNLLEWRHLVVICERHSLF